MLCAPWKRAQPLQEISSSWRSLGVCIERSVLMPAQAHSLVQKACMISGTAHFRTLPTDAAYDWALQVGFHRRPDAPPCHQQRFLSHLSQPDPQGPLPTAHGARTLSSSPGVSENP